MVGPAPPGPNDSGLVMDGQPVFIIDRLFVPVRKTNLHLMVGRSGLEQSKIPSIRKDHNKTIIATI